MKKLMFAVVALVAVVSVAVAAMELAISQQDADARDVRVIPEVWTRFPVYT